jgi:hypothetical protein
VIRLVAAASGMRRIRHGVLGHVTRDARRTARPRKSGARNSGHQKRENQRACASRGEKRTQLNTHGPHL